MPLAKVEPFQCPICSVELGPWTRGITFHARSHGLTSQDIYDRVKGIVIRPKCTCTDNCEAKVRWLGWEKGYASLVVGHFSAELVKKRTKTRVDGFKNGKHIHWAKKPENAEILQKSGQKVSATLRSRFMRGELIPSQLGRNASTDEGVRAATEKRVQLYMLGKHPRKLGYEEVVSRLSSQCDDKFTFELHREKFDNRKNNVETSIEVKCLRCGISTLETIQRLMPYNGSLRCRQCDVSISSGQREIFDFVTNLVPRVFLSDRENHTGFEIDVFIPDKNLGIEYHGLFWHSTAYGNCRDKNYHSKKSDAAAAIGIKLVQVFEDEWRDKRSIIESIIKNRLGLTANVIFARNCIIKEVDHLQRREFFEANHLDGDVRAKFTIGLYKDDSLVAALSCRDPFHRTPGTLEIARFASKLDHSVVGGLGKLVNHLKFLAQKMGYQKLMTYVDTRIGDGHGYESVGFKLTHITQPRFWWTDTIHRIDRFAIRATLEKTQEQNAEENRVFKIYGCKNKAYELLI